MTDQPPSSRTRLRELLAIPERERTDEQWDEIHLLEVETLPDVNTDGRRTSASPRPAQHQQHQPRGPGPGSGPGPGRKRRGRRGGKGQQR